MIDEGRGPAVVLLHGFPLSKEIWDAQAAALAPAARVVRPDLRCLGRSSVTAGPVLMETLAADVAGILDALGIERAVIVGHSLGSYVAFAFLRLFAERVAGLGIVCGRPDADDDAGRSRRLALADAAESDGIGPVIEFYLPRLLAPDAYRDRPDVVDAVAAICRRTDPRGAAALLRGMALRVAAHDILTDVAVPVAIVAGGADQLIPSDVQATMARALPRAAITVAASAGHLPQLESPAQVSSALQRLLAESVDAA